jgi:CBS domain-containing protein
MICPNCGTSNLPGEAQCRKCVCDLSQLDLPVAQDRVERCLMEEAVRALPPCPAVAVRPTATVGEAIQAMLDHNVGALVVVDETDRLVGILSERDLLMKVAGLVDDYRGRPVSQFMTSRPETVRGCDSLAFALHKMDLGGYRHLPVVKDGRPQGMLSVRDLLRHLTRLCKKA